MNSSAIRLLRKQGPTLVPEVFLDYASAAFSHYSHADKTQGNLWDHGNRNLDGRRTQPEHWPDLWPLTSDL